MFEEEWLEKWPGVDETAQDTELSALEELAVARTQAAASQESADKKRFDWSTLLSRLPDAVGVALSSDPGQALLAVQQRRREQIAAQQDIAFRQQEAQRKMMWEALMQQQSAQNAALLEQMKIQSREGIEGAKLEQEAEQFAVETGIKLDENTIKKYNAETDREVGLGRIAATERRTDVIMSAAKLRAETSKQISAVIDATKRRGQDISATLADKKSVAAARLSLGAAVYKGLIPTGTAETIINKIQAQGSLEGLSAQEFGAIAAASTKLEDNDMGEFLNKQMANVYTSVIRDVGDHDEALEAMTSTAQTFKTMFGIDVVNYESAAAHGSIASDPALQEEYTELTIAVQNALDGGTPIDQALEIVSNNPDISPHVKIAIQDDFIEEDPFFKFTAKQGITKKWSQGETKTATSEMRNKEPWTPY